jgi:phenylpropionate dioxygenase-like ring-hydroxylating dioxygenase large terminal subunit
MMNSLQDRDGLIAKNWHIACLSTELKNKPIQRIIYDKPYVFFRDEKGKAVCLPDRCLHRHALLSLGHCEAGKIVCPYHGWTYDEAGTVRNIPSEGPGYECSKHKTLSFPVIEQEGVIWVWTFDSTPVDHPWNFPRYHDKKWINYFMVTDFSNEVTNLAENFMDVPHTVFVHKGWFRNKSQKKIPMNIETNKGRVLVTYKQAEDEIAPLLKPLLNPQNAPMIHTDEFIYPNITHVTYAYGDKYGVIINSQCTPISTMKTRVYTYMSYRLAAFNFIIKPFIQYYTRQVIKQDVQIMDNQFKSLSFDPKTTFRSTPADEVHKAIERLRHLGQKNPQEVSSVNLSTSTEFWL